LSNKPITINQKQKMSKPFIVLLIAMISLFSVQLTAQEFEVKGKIIDNCQRLE